MATICVFLGSSHQATEKYSDEVKELGEWMATHSHCLVYGGANVGLMGLLADTVLEYHGKVIGVMPESFAKRGVAHPALTELHIVKSIQDRKVMMAELADIFVVLPGGLGTLEEMFEVLNAIKVSQYSKPFFILNIKGYFNDLIDFLKHSVDDGFLKSDFMDNVVVLNSMTLSDKI